MPETICLDDSSFSKMMESALEKRAEYTSQWKYTKESDMGITLLEMIAVLTDLQGYHADSVTESHLRQYARLLSVAPRGQKCAKIAFKNMEIKRGLSGGKSCFQVGMPLSVDGHMFEFSRRTKDGYVFIQKDTKTDFREFCVADGRNHTVRLPLYHARQSAIEGNLKVFEFEGDAWVRIYDRGVRITDNAVEVNLKPGRFRIVYGQYDKPLVTALGVSSQVVSLPYKNPLPQGLKLWAGDGSIMHDAGYTLIGQKIVLGNGGDFPILPENTDVYACRFVLSDAAVRVSRKNTVKQANNVEFSFLEVLQGGAPPESAEDALKRFSGSRMRCAVTRDDFRILAADITGHSIDNIMVEMGLGTVDITFFVPVQGLEEVKRRLAVHKPLGMRLRVENARKIPVKLRGEIDLYEDHPANRQEAADALKTELNAYFRQSGGNTPVNILLQKKLACMDIVRRVRIEALVGEWDGAGVFMPELDMEEIVYV